MINNILIAVGVLLGLFSGYLMYEREQQTRRDEQTYRFLRLGTSEDVSPLQVNEKISLGDLTTVAVPKAIAELNEFKSFAIRNTAENRAWINGRAVSQNVSKGALLNYSMFDVSKFRGFEQMIQPGMRALTIPVSVTNSVNYEVAPGSRIDVLGVIRDDTAQDGMRATVLMSGVKVIAVGRATDPQSFRQLSRRGYSTITLEVELAQALAFAMEQTRLAGGLQIVLRGQYGPDDQDCGEEGQAQDAKP